MPGPGPIHVSGGSSNILLVQSVACTNGSSGNYNCTLSATGTGNLITIQEGDYAANPTAPSVPTDGGDTFVSDCTLTNAGNGRLTFFSFPNSVSGRTTFTIRPASGASSAVVAEWSGAATSTPFDACNSALFANSSTTIFFTAPLAGSQTDLAIGGVYNRVNGTDTYSSTDVWTTLISSPDNTDGDQLYTQYIINGVKSQYTMNGTINNARTQFSAVALYKSAVAGSFSGQQPTTFLSMTGTNGTNVTTSNLPMNPNPGPLNSAGGTNCFTFSNANGLAALTTNATNGTQYTGTGVNSIAYSLSCNTATDSQLGTTLSGSATKVSAGILVLYPNTASIDTFTMGGFVTLTPDRCYPTITSPDGVNYYFYVETAGGDSSHTGVNITSKITGGTPLWFTTQMDTGSGLLCTGAVYDATTGSQIGSNVSHAVASGTPTVWTFGRFDSGVSSGTAYYIRAVVDDLNGTFPLKP